ncbi:FlhC family transcriptional regulator [Shewanella sp. GD03713]|uniref:FlhC family transcriptional regulator n=1 Tax=Shewanella TaxID=22 RepID=UPI00244C04C5|nr:FlhC family transcriptional regulator [Shewanella sp. GD03713]MDH1472656.1 FlhC family transcriptional regulator [Shewanella sp. GD03713]
MTDNSKGSKRRTQPWDPGLYYEQLRLAYEMASLGANANVLDQFFAVDKRLEMAINKDLGKFRKGAGWMTTHVIHRVHANIVYRMYCNAIPENANLERPITDRELLSLARTYHVLHNNQYVDINRIFYIFCYLSDGTFSRKICSKCGMDFIFHSERNYSHCPFCERDSPLFDK